MSKAIMEKQDRVTHWIIVSASVLMPYEQSIRGKDDDRK